MGVLLAEVAHGGLERSGHVAGLDIGTVEVVHEFGGAAVVDVPEGEKKRSGAGAEQTSLETKEFVPRGDEIHAGGATAQRDEARAKANLVEIIKIQVTIAEPDAREHRIVLAIDA